MTPEDAEEYTQSLGQIGGGLWRQVMWAHRQGVPEALGLSLREWVDGRLGGYVRMAVEERRKVVAELVSAEEVFTQQEIADVLGVDQSQISRDVMHLHNEDQDDAGQESTDDPAVMQVHNREELPDPEADRSELIQELARRREPEPVNEPPPLPTERFACIVIDPPWPMKKIERKERAWQGVELDYPVMSLAQIEALPVPDLAEDDSHLYLWVTHRFLPDGLRLLSAWGFKYQCLMTWCKNTGIVPYSWMYDTEHVVFATRGSLKIAKRGLRLSFDEPVEGHSIKPTVFYERVLAASPGPRLEMFARRQREGFTAWGNEVACADV